MALERNDAGTSTLPAITGSGGLVDALLAASEEAAVLWTVDGTVTAWNAGAEALLGYARDEIVGTSVRRLMRPDSWDEIDHSVGRLLGGQTVDTFVAQRLGKSGVSLEVTITRLPVTAPDGRITHFLSVLRNIERSEISGRAMRRLVDCSRLVGQAFLDAMVEALARSISVRTAFLGIREPGEPARITVRSIWQDGQPGEPFSFEAEGRPCARILEGEVCFFATHVARFFPTDTRLQEMKAQGYIGAPLRSSDGQVIGVLAAIHDAPLDSALHPVEMLEIFGGRAAAELEREAATSRNEYLGRLVEEATSEAFVFDTESLNFVLVNRGARENLGYTNAELARLTPLDLTPGFSREAFLELIAPLRDDDTDHITYETRHRRKDGSFYPVAVRMQLFRNPGPPVFFAAAEDITARRSIEAALRLSEARLRQIFTHMQAGVVETDREGRMVTVNQMWCDMLGYSEAELLGRSVREVTDLSSDEATSEALVRVLSEGHETQFEKSYRRRDGSVFQASTSISALHTDEGQVRGAVAVVVDISERMRAEEVLRESETRLRSILDGTLAFVGVLSPDGTLQEINAPALEVAGLQRDEVIGRKFWDCYWWSHDSEDVARLQAAIAQAAGNHVVRYDALWCIRDGEQINVDFMLSPVLDARGEVASLVLSGFDISERKAQEEQLRLLMREVNHRSKNLLSVVQAIARQMRVTEPEEFIHRLDGRLRSLSASQDLLVYSGWTRVPIGDLVRSQISHFGELLDQRIFIEGSRLGLSVAAAQALGMAIYELATNSVKYGALKGESGQVEIRWSIETAADGEKRFVMTWQETGGAPVTAPRSRGFGTVVLDTMVTMTLQGETELEFPPEGLRWRLECPAEALLESGEPAH